MSIDLSSPTGNFWMDNGLVTLYCEFGEGNYDSDYILEKLTEKIVQKTGNKGKYFDKKKEELVEYEKVNWKYPTNQFIKVSGKAGTKVKIDGEEYSTQPPIFDLKLKLSKRHGICNLCGIEAPLTDAKMWMFPFMVEPSKFGNFYSGSKRGFKLCARCALAGLAGYIGWLWKAQGKVLHFFVFHSDLSTMERLHREVFLPLRAEGEKGGNTPRLPFWGSYIHETTLGLLLSLFSYISNPKDIPEETSKCLASLFRVGSVPSSLPSFITLYAVTGIMGQAFSMKSVKEITKLHSLYKLYEKWVNEFERRELDNPPRQIALVLRQFMSRQGNKDETLWRDKVARAILDFADPFPIMETFIFDVRAKEKPPKPLVMGTLDMFNIYLKEVLNMDEKFQRILAGFGYTLGRAAKEDGEMGLLYALRNAKKPEEFYRVLNDAQFRLEMTIPEALLRIEKGERIFGVPWVRVKTLLAIYAMNSYLREYARKDKDSATLEKEE